MSSMLRKRALLCLMLASSYLMGAAAAADVEWKPVLEMDGHLFPSYIIAVATVKIPGAEKDAKNPAHLGDPVGLIGVRITPPEAGQKIKVTIAESSVFAESTFEGVLPDAKTEYTIYPKIKYDYEKLLDSSQKMPLNVSISVTLDDEPLGEKTETVTLRPIHDCPFGIVGDQKKGLADTDLGFMFAAYVNEDHPVIDDILKEALATKIVNSFDGYQSKDPEKVYAQVFAIWHVLQKRGIKYSSITATAASSNKVFSQHVRLMDESLDAEQANCVDGSVLVAAILRKIGLAPSLVIVPGHCLLSFKLGPDGDRFSGLETTMLGVDDLKETEENHEDIDDTWKQEASYKTFIAALQTGTGTIVKNKDNLNKSASCQVIDIAAARKLGITPIAYLREQVLTRTMGIDMIVEDRENAAR